MNLCVGSSIVAFGVTLEFKAGDHGVTECTFYELVVGESAGEVLQCGDYTCVADPQKFSIVVEAV